MEEGVRWVKTHCARMDHGGCALLVGVKGNEMVRVKGDPEGFLSRGYICPKGVASPDRLTHPDRLRYPLKRKGDRGEGKWERISWDEALETVAGGLLKIREEHGPRAVAFGVGMPKGLEHFVLIRLANLSDPQRHRLPGRLPRTPGDHGAPHLRLLSRGGFPSQKRPGGPWGSNITSTNEEGEICKLLLDQVKDGMELIVIDPRRIDLAKKAKFCSRSARDGPALALGFLNVTSERASTTRHSWSSGQRIRRSGRACEKIHPRGRLRHHPRRGGAHPRGCPAYAAAAGGDPVGKPAGAHSPHLRRHPGAHLPHGRHGKPGCPAATWRPTIPGSWPRPLRPADLIPDKRKDMISAPTG